MGSLRESKTYLLNSANFHEIVVCLKRVFDLSKEVFQVSLGRRATKLQVAKVRKLKKDSAAWPESCHTHAFHVQVQDDGIILKA